MAKPVTAIAQVQVLVKFTAPTYTAGVKAVREALLACYDTAPTEVEVIGVRDYFEGDWLTEDDTDA